MSSVEVSAYLNGQIVSNDQTPVAEFATNVAIGDTYEPYPGVKFRITGKHWLFFPDGENMKISFNIEPAGDA